MKKLYAAIVRVPIVVLANDEEEAKKLCVKHAKEEADNVEYKDVYEVHHVTCRSDLPSGWDSHCIPYGTLDPPKDPTIIDFIQE